MLVVPHLHLVPLDSRGVRVPTDSAPLLLLLADVTAGQLLVLFLLVAILELETTTTGECVLRLHHN